MPTAFTDENATSNDAVLSLRNITHIYAPEGGKPTKALEDVSVDISHGELVALLGPSGCGKSTLLKIAGGIIDQTEGRIRFEGTHEKVPGERLGIVFQTPVLLPWRTVIKNVHLPAEILRIDSQESLARAHQLLEMTGVSGFDDNYPGELSGGMQQRVSIARALLHDPEVLLMDEPFGALDAITREQLNAELQSIHMRERKTILFVTHDVKEAIFLSDRIAVLTDRPGRLASVIDNRIPRPRTAESQLSNEFIEMELEIRSLLGHDKGEK